MTVTARVEVEFPLTLNEGNIVRAAAAKINASDWSLNFVQQFVDGLRIALNADLEDAPWFVYRGGSHVALIKDGERILLVTEEQADQPGDDDPAYIAHLEALQTPPVAAPQAPQATTAPTIQPNDPVDMFVNQGVREGYVLAVLGDEYLVEYTMPKGTTSLQIFNRTVPNIIWKGKSYPNPTNGKSVSYKALPTRWLQAIVDAGTTWEGRAQGVYAAPGRYGYGGNHKTVPSAADLLAAKGRRKASSDVCEHGYAQGCRACNPDGGR